MIATIAFGLLSIYELVYLANTGSDLAFILFIAFVANTYIAYEVESQ